jgi:hypothetical protein
MSYRRAEVDELLEIMPQLRTYTQWQSMRHLIAEIYGPTVIRVFISVVSVYNDEYNNPEPHVVAYDATGKDVPLDYHTPFFAHITLTDEEQKDEDAQRASYPDEYIENDYLDWKRQEAFHKRLVQALNLPDAVYNGYDSTFAFDFTKTPEVPLLFIKEAGA